MNLRVLTEVNFVSFINGIFEFLVARTIEQRIRIIIACTSSIAVCRYSREISLHQADTDLVN